MTTCSVVAVDGSTPCQRIRFGVSAAQGGRSYMEDRFAAVTSLRALAPHGDSDGVFASGGSPISLFAVFDGHGGRDAAALCSRRLPSLVAGLLCKRGATAASALRSAFVAVDEQLALENEQLTQSAAAAGTIGSPRRPSVSKDSSLRSIRSVRFGQVQGPVYESSEWTTVWRANERTHRTAHCTAELATYWTAKRAANFFSHR